jgi:hypothetical protein
MDGEINIHPRTVLLKRSIRTTATISHIAVLPHTGIENNKILFIIFILFFCFVFLQARIFLAGNIVFLFIGYWPQALL